MSPKPGPKLRASCDGCYTAKIKCTKERPTCPRCKSLGLVCHYSPSQRAGGKSREARSRASSTWASQTPSWTPNTSSNKSSPVVPTDHQPQHWESTNLQTSNVSHALQPDLTMSDRPGSSSMLADFDNDYLAPWRDYLPTPDKESSTFSLSDELLMYGNPAEQRLTEHELISTTPPVTHDDFRTCDCFLSIVQTLHAMQNQSQGTRIPSLETVLSDSRDVIARGEAVLRCACSDDSTLIMLLTGLIAKHLSFYGYSGNGMVSSPASSASSVGESNLPFPSSRVTIGKYTMEGEDEEWLRTEIMMMELQKMGTLLMKFRGKLSSLPVGYEGHTYETVLNFLNMRLREATDGLQRRKQRLKGDA